MPHRRLVDVMACRPKPAVSIGRLLRTPASRRGTRCSSPRPPLADSHGRPMYGRFCRCRGRSRCRSVLVGSAKNRSPGPRVQPTPGGRGIVSDKLFLSLQLVLAGRRVSVRHVFLHQAGGDAGVPRCGTVAGVPRLLGCRAGVPRLLEAAGDGVPRWYIVNVWLLFFQR